VLPVLSRLFSVVAVANVCDLYELTAAARLLIKVVALNVDMAAARPGGNGLSP
jgi:hypothetical protein